MRVQAGGDDRTASGIVPTVVAVSVRHATVCFGVAKIRSVASEGSAYSDWLDLLRRSREWTAKLTAQATLISMDLCIIVGIDNGLAVLLNNLNHLLTGPF